MVFPCCQLDAIFARSNGDVMNKNAGYAVVLRKIFKSPVISEMDLGEGSAGRSLTEAATDAYDISAWRRPVRHYNGIASALVEGVGIDGIHRIVLANGRTLDVCSQNMSLLQTSGNERVLLVGLNGAVAERNGKKAPFFSGLGIANSLRLPAIAISDPTLALDPDLPLAWYAGNEEVPDLPNHIACLLDGLAEVYQSRLIVFGGSGGGYAGLLLATLLECRATVLVWNPQTAIADYVPEFVEKYIDVAFPSLSRNAPERNAETMADRSRHLREFLDMTTVVHDVRDLKLPPQIEILYLQNRSDWHVTCHAAPYLAGKFWERIGRAAFMEQESKQIGLFFGHWGEGHVAPPRDYLEMVLRKLAEGELIHTVIRELDGSHGRLCGDDLDFHWLASNVGLKLEANARVVSGRVHAKSSVGQEGAGTEGIMYAFYLLVDGVRQAVRWYEPCSEVHFDLPDKAGRLQVVAFARSQPENQVSVRIPVWG